MGTQLMLIISANDYQLLTEIVTNKKINCAYTINGESLLSRAVTCKAYECFDIVFEQLLLQKTAQSKILNSSSAYDYSGLSAIIDYTHIETETSPYDYFLTKILEQTDLLSNKNIWLNMISNIGPNFIVLTKLVNSIIKKVTWSEVGHLLGYLSYNSHLKKFSNQLIPIYICIFDHMLVNHKINQPIEILTDQTDQTDQNIDCTLIQFVKEIKENSPNGIMNHDYYHHVPILNQTNGQDVCLRMNIQNSIHTAIRNKNYALFDIMASKLNIIYGYYHTNLECNNYLLLQNSTINPLIYWVLVFHPDFVDYLLPKYTQFTVQELNSIPNIKTFWPYIHDLVKLFETKPLEYISGLKSIFNLGINFNFNHICLKLIDEYFLSDGSQPVLLLFWLLKEYPDKIDINEIISGTTKQKLLSIMNNNLKISQKLFDVLSYANCTIDQDIKLNSDTKFIDGLIEKITQTKSTKKNLQKKSTKKNLQKN
jgi:hypothetical protein